jgi:ABC-2 type transport system permease protein
MGNLFTLISREVRSLVVSPILWVVLVMFLLFNGVSFWELLVFLSQPMAPEGAPMQVFFGKWMIFWLAVLTMSSIIPMGTLASEVRNGTIETLMTAPVTEWQVVLAKFFASWLFYAALWAPTLVYVGLLMKYSDPDLGPIFSGYLGTLLLGGCFLSIGVLMSAATRNQIVAAVMSFGCYGCLFLLSLLAYLPSQGGNMDVVNYLNLWEHMDNWGRGVVDTRHITYYLTVTVFALFCSVRVLESRRWR